MGKTITEKILAKSSGNTSAAAGDYLTVKPDVVVLIDTGTSINLINFFEENNLHVWNPDKIVFVFDHLAIAMSKQHERVRRFCKAQGIHNVFDIGSHGLSHQVPAEEGFVLPGSLYINVDTMASTMGGLSCVALVGSSDTEAIAALGETWIRVPDSIRFELVGKLRTGVTSRDLFQAIMKDVGHKVSSSVMEFTGAGASGLSIDSRMALCNSVGLMGATTAIFNPDAKTLEYVSGRARQKFTSMKSDSDASYISSYEFDLGKIEPFITAPHSADNVKPLSEVLGVHIDQAYLGSCASARIEDLRLAALILKGKKISHEVRMIVTPISSRVFAEAVRLGYIATFAEAGATITTPGCGACWSGCQSPGQLTGEEVCITTSPENSKGRMGSLDSKVYIGNAAVVAASALEGKIADPMKYMRDA